MNSDWFDSKNDHNLSDNFLLAYLKGNKECCV